MFTEDLASRAHFLPWLMKTVPAPAPCALLCGTALARVVVKRVAYGDLVYSAHRLFHTGRRLFVDLILNFQERTDILAFFRKLEMEQAFKVVEIELVLMYESLHSKAPVIHGWLGRGLRVFTLAAPVVSLVLFARAAGETRGYGYASVDVDISYVLLAAPPSWSPTPSS